MLGQVLVGLAIGVCGALFLAIGHWLRGRLTTWWRERRPIVVRQPRGGEVQLWDQWLEDVPNEIRATGRTVRVGPGQPL